MFGLSVFPFRPPSSDLSKMSWKQNKDQISWMPVPFLLPSFPSAREVPGVVASPLGQHSRPTAREAEPGPLSSSFPCLAHLCSWGTIYIRSTFASHFLKQTAEQGRGERRTRRCPRGQKELELGVWDLRGGVGSDIARLPHSLGLGSLRTTPVQRQLLQSRCKGDPQHSSLPLQKALVISWNSLPQLSERHHHLPSYTGPLFPSPPHPSPLYQLQSGWTPACSTCSVHLAPTHLGLEAFFPLLPLQSRNPCPTQHQVIF